MAPIEPVAIDIPRGPFGARALGSADAPLVVCLHGFPDDAGTFDDLLPRLATAGFRPSRPICADTPPRLWRERTEWATSRRISLPSAMP